MKTSVTPIQFSCWFCHKKLQESEEVMFSGEFDAYLHEACLEDELKKDPDNQEARIIARELGVSLITPSIEDLDL